MEFLALDSSALAGIRYDAGSRVLWVLFRDSGLVYRYFEVPAWRVSELAEPPGGSIGAYFNRDVKPDYACELVGPAAELGVRLVAAAELAARR